MRINYPRLLRFSLNLIVICFLIWLPYFLFQGRLFPGGDDTRLHYIYPMEFIKNLSFFSWVNISSLPSYLPNHHSIPYLLFLSFLGEILRSKTEVFYFAFSFPFVIGFIYFQKFINELIDGSYEIPFVAALIYILSPITIVSQMFNFLFSMYLIALIPIIAYYYVAFLKRGKTTDILKAIFWSIFFSIAFYAIQWILGFLLSFVCAVILMIIVDNPIRKFFKRSFIFYYFIFSSQIFWLLPFVMSLVYKGGNSLGGKVSSQGFHDSFASTVISTATGNVLYPLLNLYQRQIAFGYDWQLKNVYINFYDHVMPLSIVFIFVLFLGIFKYNQILTREKKKIFIFFFFSFIIVLYFSTVNIGIFKNIFLFLGNIPGFAIFRNFTDKFSLSYVFTYSTLIALCLYVIKKAYKIYPLILLATIVIFSINILPIKQIVVSPLWRTTDIFTTVNLPEEYLSFLEKVKSNIPNNTNVISFPQNVSAYEVITEDNGKNAYIGTSPFKYLTGVNDLSGSYSYPAYISNQIQELIIGKDYEGLLSLLSKINVSYAMVTSNIPDEVLNSYLYDKGYLAFQDKELVESLSKSAVLRSDKGNYIIYKLKNSPQVMSSNGEIQYKKVSLISYQIKLTGVKKNEKFFFHETYHPGWNLYLVKDDLSSTKYKFLPPLGKTIFKDSHRELEFYGNEWSIDQNEVRNKFDKSYYKENKNGTIDINLTLYFFPQIYFYLGIVISLGFLSPGILYLIKRRLK